MARRYLTVFTRPGLFTNCSLADPFGQRRPREIGEFGSPSICTTRSPLTYTRWPQPTAQYGQMLLTTRSAVLVRGVMASVCAERTAVPSPQVVAARDLANDGPGAELFADAHWNTPELSMTGVCACRGVLDPRSATRQGAMRGRWPRYIRRHVHAYAKGFRMPAITPSSPLEILRDACRSTASIVDNVPREQLASPRPHVATGPLRT